MEESARRTVGGHDAAVVGGLGDIAACAAGHQDFDAGPLVFFEQQRPPPALGGSKCGNQPGRPGPDDDNIPRALIRIAR